MTTTFAQLQAMVYVETNRPDAVQQTINAIQAATQFCHGLDYFFKDILEANVVFDTPQYIQYLQTSDFLRFRTLKVIRKWDPFFAQSQNNPNILPPLPYTNFGYSVNDNIALRKLKCIEGDDIFDSFNREKPDVYYQVGSNIKIKSSTAVPQAIVQWYAWPNVGTLANTYTDYQSWAADEYPFAIVYYAAANCFGQFGDLDSANRYFNQTASGQYKGAAAQHIYNMIQNNIVARGW